MNISKDFGPIERDFLKALYLEAFMKEFDGMAFRILALDLLSSIGQNGTGLCKKTNDGIGSVLKDIKPEEINGTWAKKFYQETIGHMEGLSFKDTALINHIYCNETCKEKNWCLNGGYLNPNDCSKCLCPDGFAGTYCGLLELNLNCEETSGTPRELEAERTNKVLKPRIKCNGARLCCPGALRAANVGIGSILNDIEKEKINGTWAKKLHFVPPSTRRMEIYFQIANPEFSTQITQDESLKPSENDPNKTWPDFQRTVKSMGTIVKRFVNFIEN
uniref:EGF-like domain-containing protein n=1 Tax=Globodera pallida TaxID=36090 RepID=A0A183CKD6_GLOPA